MNYEDIITAFELYYGRYDKYVKNKLIKYMIDNYEHKELPYIEELIFKNYSNRWKVPPDIATIEEIIKKDNDDMTIDELKLGYSKKNNKNIEYKEVKKIENKEPI